MWLRGTENFKQLLQLLLNGDREEEFKSNTTILNRTLLSVERVVNTLNREPMEENFDVLDESSAKDGNNPETNGHVEAFKRA